MQRKVPQEFIVVEGRSDTQRLREIFGPTVQTIETTGSALPRAIVETIQHAQSKFGVIVLTDPDYQGERVRRLIAAHIPEVKHAYINPEECLSPKAGRSLGVEHAPDEVIVDALAHVMTPLDDRHSGNLIPMRALMQLGLIGHPLAAARREYLTRTLRIGHQNGKQLQRQLAKYQINLEEVEDILKKGECHGAIESLYRDTTSHS